MEPRERHWEELHSRFLEAWFSQNISQALLTARDELKAAHDAFGEEHPTTLRSCLDLAMALKADHQDEEARNTEERAMKLSERLDAYAKANPKDLLTASWLVFEADRWWNILGDDADKVISPYKTALSIREARLGPAHPECADVVARLAEVAYLQGDFHAAEERYRQALSMYEKAGDLERPYFMKSVEGLAQTLKVLDRYLEAGVLFAQALANADEKGKEKKSLYYLLISYAECLDHLEERERAEALRQRAESLLPQTNPGIFGYQS